MALFTGFFVRSDAQELDRVSRTSRTLNMIMKNVNVRYEQCIVVMPSFQTHSAIFSFIIPGWGYLYRVALYFNLYNQKLQLDLSP